MAVDRELAREVAKRWSARRHVAIGMIALLVLVGGLGVWSAYASITGAVVAPGQLKVESRRQVVQHPDGGVVAEIMVKEGDTVEAGQPLLRLDDTLLRGDLAIVEGQLYELMARTARLAAERDGAEEIAFPQELLDAAAEDEAVQSLLDGQQRLFLARKETAEKEEAQLRERQAQIEEQIAGAEAQREALERQLELVGKELKDLRKLLEKGLAQASRVLALERENARLLGQAGEITATMARLKGQISEIELQLLGVESSRREDAIAQLRDFEFRLNELRERRASLRETIDRMVIRAPRPGTVIGMTVHTLRSVVRPAEPILYIVPSDVGLVVEAKIRTTDIEQVHPGQPARLRFAAFSTRTTPDVPGRVVRVSPDAFTDDRTGLSWYTVELTFDKEGIKALGDVELIAGMPVEAFITTGDRTPFNYLTKPLANYFRKAFRES